MNQFFSPVSGAGYLLTGLKLITQAGIRKFVIIPLLINFLIFSILILLGMNYFGGLIDSVMPSLPDWLWWLSWLLWLVFGLATMVIVFYTFSVIANLVAAPFNGLLAEAVAYHLTSQKTSAPGNTGDAIKDLAPAMMAELHKLTYMLMWMIPALFLFVIPGINLFAPFIWAILSAWLLGLEYLDYSLANQGLLFKQQRQLARGQRFGVLGFGAAVTVATMIPVLNFLVMPAAVAGATAFALNRFPQQFTSTGNSQDA